MSTPKTTPTDSRKGWLFIFSVAGNTNWTGCWITKDGHLTYETDKVPMWLGTPEAAEKEAFRRLTQCKTIRANLSEPWTVECYIAKHNSNQETWRVDCITWEKFEANKARYL